MDLKSKSCRVQKSQKLTFQNSKFQISISRRFGVLILVLVALMILSVGTLAHAQDLTVAEPLSRLTFGDKIDQFRLTIKITKYASKYKLERRLLSCLLKVESGYKVNAISETSDFGIGQINMRNIEAHNYDLKRLVSDLDYSIDIAAAHLAGVQSLFRPFEPSTWPCRYNIGNRSITTPGLGWACVAYNAKLADCFQSAEYL